MPWIQLEKLFESNVLFKSISIDLYFIKYSWVLSNFLSFGTNSKRKKQIITIKLREVFEKPQEGKEGKHILYKHTNCTYFFVFLDTWEAIASSISLIGWSIHRPIPHKTTTALNIILNVKLQNIIFYLTQYAQFPNQLFFYG